jgi:hypothetical protein
MFSQRSRPPKPQLENATASHTVRYSKQFIRLSISLMFAFGIAVISFVYWAPWTASLTVEEALLRYPGQVDQSWRAVQVEHGQVREWRLGTLRQNPRAYGLCTASLMLSVMYCVATALWLERHRHERTNTG